jgi:hypothetical protein
MSLFSTIRATDRSRLPGDDPPRIQGRRLPSRSKRKPRCLDTFWSPSPGSPADVTSLQQRYGDAPQLHEGLERILGKLVGLVDSIYQRAADPVPPSVHRAARTAGSLSAARVEAPIDFAGASNVVRPPIQGERSLPRHTRRSARRSGGSGHGHQPRCMDTRRGSATDRRSSG